MDRAYHAAAKKIDRIAEAKDSDTPVSPGRAMVVCKPTSNPEYVRRFGDRADPGEPGSLRHLCDAFMVSDEFAALDAAGTQKMYRRNLLKICALHEGRQGRLRRVDRRADEADPYRGDQSPATGAPDRRRQLREGAAPHVQLGAQA